MQEQYRIIDERVAADEERTKIYAIPGIIKPLAAEQPSGGADREDDEEDELTEDGDGESDDGASEDISDDELRIFPRPKTITSDITGRPKRVYPPIEPDYDSDSSTEEVRLLIYRYRTTDSR